MDAAEEVEEEVGEGEEDGTRETETGKKVGILQRETAASPKSRASPRARSSKRSLRQRPPSVGPVLRRREALSVSAGRRRCSAQR